MHCCDLLFSCICGTKFNCCVIKVFLLFLNITLSVTVDLQHTDYIKYVARSRNSTVAGLNSEFAMACCTVFSQLSLNLPSLSTCNCEFPVQFQKPNRKETFFFTSELKTRSRADADKISTKQEQLSGCVFWACVLILNTLPDQSGSLNR